MDRFRKIAAGTYPLSVSTVPDDGAPETVTAPTITVTDGAGAVVATGVPTYAAGALSYALDAALCARLDTYHAAWTGTMGGVAWSWVSDFDLAAGYFCEIAEIRALDTAFASSSSYPLATLRAARTQIEDALELAGKVAFVRRGRRVSVSGSARGVRELLVPDFEVAELYSGTIDGTALTVTELAAITPDDNVLVRDDTEDAWPYGRLNIGLHYAHGREFVPSPIKRAALTLFREYLVPSPLPGRATATSIGDQMFRLTIAGRDGHFGIPDVDVAVDDCGRKRYSAA